VTFVLILATLVIRAARWRILLGRTVSLRDTFGLIGIGYLISGVLPLRAGDPARAVGASLRGSISAIAALSTVIVERVLDMLLIVMMLLATVPFVPGLQGYLATGQLNEYLSFSLVLALSGILAFGILLVFVLVAVFPATTEQLARRVLATFHVPNVERWLKPVQSIVEGLSALRSAKDGLAIGVWSIALWLVSASISAPPCGRAGTSSPNPRHSKAWSSCGPAPSGWSFRQPAASARSTLRCGRPFFGASASRGTWASLTPSSCTLYPI
jgi:uncharacterized protein (TIRG00374 family)